MMKHMSAILPLLDAEPYPIRNGVALCIGHCVAGTTRTAWTGLGGDAPEEEEEDGEAGAGNQELRSVESFTKTRDSLLNVLTERAHDVNSYTRAAVLKAWAILCEHHSLPTSRLHDTSKIAMDRMHDKSTVVRKAAVQVRCCEGPLLLLRCDGAAGLLLACAVRCVSA